MSAVGILFFDGAVKEILRAFGESRGGWEGESESGQFRGVNDDEEGFVGLIGITQILKSLRDEIEAREIGREVGGGHDDVEQKRSTLDRKAAGVRLGWRIKSGSISRKSSKRCFFSTRPELTMASTSLRSRAVALSNLASA